MSTTWLSTKALVIEYKWEIAEYLWYSLWLSGFLCFDYPVLIAFGLGFGLILATPILWKSAGHITNLASNWANTRIDSWEV